MILKGRKFPVLFAVLVAASAVAASGCSSSSDSDSDACSVCQSHADCDSGLSCFTFNDGVNRCAEKEGDACTTQLLSAAPAGQYSPFEVLFEAEEEAAP